MNLANYQESKDAVFGLLQMLKDNLAAQSPSFKLTEDKEDLVVIETLRRYGEYLWEHPTHKSQLDAFKIVRWMGASILDNFSETGSKWPSIVNAIISTQEEILFLDSHGKKRAPPSIIALRRRMLLDLLYSF